MAKTESTFDRIMRNPKRRKQFEEEYGDLVRSELVLALMEDDEKSVRKLAAEAGLSPAVIQNIRSGKQKNIRLDNFRNIAHACGYSLVLEKDGERIPV